MITTSYKITISNQQLLFLEIPVIEKLKTPSGSSHYTKCSFILNVSQLKQRRIQTLKKKSYCTSLVTFLFVKIVFSFFFFNKENVF